MPRRRATPPSNLPWAQGGKGDNVPDRWAVGQQHDQPIDANAEPAARGQPILEGDDVILVERLSLLVARRPRLHLRLETGPLVLRIGELGKRVGNLPAVDVGLEALSEPRVAAICFG